MKSFLSTEDLSLVSSLIQEAKFNSPRDFKYITIDYFLKSYLSGEKSCKDTSFHIDGRDNYYLLFCLGEGGTVFLTEEVNLPLSEELGYDMDFEVVNSKNFGLAQNRERVFYFGKLRE